ncbi:MAG: hypothetical protein HY674_19700 [Chloroflexi bacterium]|nr:hypothetical protein [Chloroflexota bacterium]
MNRIYQGKVTNVEIANPDTHAQPILSASIPFSASDGEKVAQPDEVSPESGERTEVRCRNCNSQHSPFNSQLSPHSHQLFQDAVILTPAWSSPGKSVIQPKNRERNV